MIVAVRIRGSWKVRHDIEKTMELLGLRRTNHAVLLQRSPSIEGMLKKANAYVTWGPISKEILTKLLEEKAEVSQSRKLTLDYLKARGFNSFEECAQALIEGKTSFKALGIKNVFRLHPPRKGYERGGIKKPFKLGGALGFRGEKINELIARMM
jgi:large subunit ribosomal protein L30